MALRIGALQDTYVRQVASDRTLWEPLALARWPGADAERQYAGNWHRLYLVRAPLNHTFPLAADRVRAVTAAQQQRHAEQQQVQRGAGSRGESSAAAAGAGGQGGHSGRAASVAALPHLAFEDVMRQTFNAGLACSK